MDPIAELEIFQAQYRDYRDVYGDDAARQEYGRLAREAEKFDEWRGVMLRRKQQFGEPYPGYFERGNLYMQDLDGPSDVYYASNTPTRRLELWAQTRWCARQVAKIPGVSPAMNQ